MNPQHLNILTQLENNNPGYIGNNSFKWAKSVFTQADNLDPYLDRRLDRYDLLEYCQNKKNDNLNVVIAILSWGGMRRDHARILLSNPDILLTLVQSLRNGDYLTREEAFAAIQNHRLQGNFTGTGNWLFHQTYLLLGTKFERLYYGSMGCEIG